MGENAIARIPNCVVGTRTALGSWLGRQSSYSCLYEVGDGAMNRTFQLITFGVAAALPFVSSKLSAQRPLSIPAATLQRFGDVSNTERILAIFKSGSPAAASALSDSLVAYASSSTQGAARFGKTDAISALSMAASDRSSPNALIAEAHLRNIVDVATDRSTKASALVMLSRLPDKMRAITHLSEIASSSSVVAERAVDVLSLMGPPGLEELKRLYRAGSVNQPDAKSLIGVMARARDW